MSGRPALMHFFIHIAMILTFKPARVMDHRMLSMEVIDSRKSWRRKRESRFIALNQALETQIMEYITNL